MPYDDSELALYIDNDSDLYASHRKPAYQKLADAKIAGTYARAMAIREFMALADAGAKKYQKDVGRKRFTDADKREYAEGAADYFETEWDLGNMRQHATEGERMNPSIPMLGIGAKANPYEVHSASGLEGVFADPDDAEVEAAILRQSGAKGVVVIDRRRRLQTRHAQHNPSDRLFIGVYPTGIVYADRSREIDGDYARVAFLPYSTLQLEWSPGKHSSEIIEAVEHDAATVAAQRGQPFEVSSSGQTVTLGGGVRNPPFVLPVPGQRIRSWDHGNGTLLSICEFGNDGQYTANISLDSGNRVSVPLVRTEYDLEPRKALERRTGFSRHEQFVGRVPERFPKGTPTPMEFDPDETVVVAPPRRRR